MGVEEIRAENERLAAEGRLPAVVELRRDVSARTPLSILAPCEHEGAVLEWCTKCGNTEGSHVRDCDLHERCTREPVGSLRACRTCPDHTARQTAPFVRHLIYHIWPVHGGIWRWNVEQLLRRIKQFNGSRTVAIVIDQSTDHVEEVQAAFGGEVTDFIIRPNNPDLREVATWEPLLKRAMVHAGKSDITFYGHAKGVSRHGHATVQPWTEALYETCLDYPEVVDRVLSARPLAGSFKKTGQGFADPSSKWHYSGSLFWMRNAEVAKRGYQQVPREWWGVESWPGIAFQEHEAGTIFFEGKNPQVDLYDPKFVRETMTPALRRWKLQQYQSQPAPKELKIELGGGRKSRGSPWVNVDLDPVADVQLDLASDPLPWPDASVSEVYSSHCLEHVTDLKHLLRELVRVCKRGATIEIRVPHWHSDMAMYSGHVQTISETAISHWCDHFPQETFGGCARRLKLASTEFIPHPTFERAAEAFPHLFRDEVMRFIPGTCHEIRYHFEVIDNDGR